MTANKPLLILSLIDPKRRLLFRIGMYLFLFSLPLMFLSALFIENNVAGGSFTLLVIIGLILTSFKSYSISGKLLFYHDIILSQQGSRKEKFELDKSHEIKFEVNEYKGEEKVVFNPIMVHKREGSNNYVTIISGEQSNRFQVLIKRQNLNRLNQLAQANSKFNLVQKGKEVNSLRA